ncbi:MAG: hypothetical protein Q9220_001565 [cf. Caloplaca sp. 1 TL-2023]
MADEYGGNKEVLDWYGKLPTRRVDLVGDYAGQELFIVEGDGLLLRCFDNPELDFTDGFQLLHAAYAVEHFLQGLVQRKCNFHIVFFELHKELCIPRATPAASRSRYLLARAIVMRHLTVNLKVSHPSIRVYVFKSALDPAFQDYLTASGAYFVMTHDGANPLPLENDPRYANGNGPDLESLEHIEIQRRSILRTTIFTLISHGYNVALINGLEWMDTKIMTMVVEGTRKSKSSPKISDAAFAPYTNGSAKDEDSHRPEPDLPEEDMHAVLEAAVKTGGVSLTSQTIQQEPWKDLCTKAGLTCDVIDFLDGRLLAQIWVGLEGNLDSHVLSTQLQSKIRTYANLVTMPTSSQKQLLGAQSSSDVDREPRAALDVHPTGKLAILPFSHTVFDKHMAPVSITVRPSKNPSGKSARIFREVSHWHNAKRRLDPKSSYALSDRDKARALRRNQFFMAEMAGYAASLTGVTGKILEPELITVSEGGKPLKDSTERSKENVKAVKSSKNKTTKGPSSAKSIIAANTAAKGGGVVEKVMAAWKTKRISLDAEHLLQSRYRKTNAYLRDLASDKKDILQAEVEYYMICVLLKMYWMVTKKPQPEIHTQINGIAALLFSRIRSLTTARGLSKAVIAQVKSIIDALGFPDVGFPTAENERKLSFDFDLHLNGIKSAADSHKDFQLLHCGPYMDRNLDSAADPRVNGFDPDGWQRKVLDELDADRSIFVVAPTSAGKTFISFYAMEKILRKNEDSVLVYVAPTKALVNQIGAEIQARFKKQYKHAGRSVWAIHTRDYRINNPTGCQILVTVPHILQIMLLSSSNAKSWSSKVKCIIFDEIHSIGQAEDGVVWEQLLLLAPCPIIALSATVGNPEQFNSWLTSTQRASGFDITMITHQHRYSDLRKFLYKPPKQFTFTGLPDPSFATLGLDGLSGLAFVHPIGCLVNKSRGMPQDLSLEARDCLLLWRSMCQHQTKAFPVSDELNPDRLPQVIRKTHIIEWENQLKTLLRTWMAQDSSPFDRVVEDLGKAMNEAKGTEHYTSWPEANLATMKARSVDADDLYQTTLPLLCKLQERDALPAILFNYDRQKCEGICQSILLELKEAEASWKESSPVWAKKMKAYEQYLKDKSKHDPKKAAITKGKGRVNNDEETTKADRMQDAASEDANVFANFDPDAAVVGFHFANIAKAEAAELAAIHKELKRRELAPWLMESLTRGIGVHHAGMNRKYRQAVEMLFRKGFLRVVIATGTLALGINMPCATVVFSGDSVFLTALNFRQAAGRAGRRGFDLLGNVVFQNLTTAKVCRLLSSRLPDLTGHFPVTTTLVLRLFTLLYESGNTKYAVDAINSLLSQPRLYLDGAAFKDQVLHHLRFSIEYLRQHDLLSAEGVPLNFAGLTSHLYYTENSSFALNALLKEGFFHELCSDIDTAESRVLRTLMIVMAHLFGRRPCRHSDQEYIEEIVKRSPSVVFLPPLPDSASKTLQQHNQQTLKIFTAYVQTFVDQHIKEPDRKLPLTGISVGSNNKDNDSIDSIPSFLTPLPPTKIRSPFVALSGHSDTFTTISSLCRTVRSGVFLEESVIPHLDVYPDETETPLNAYLYDFYMHGDVDSLERANGIRKSDVWFFLNDFSLVLATIQTSLANFMKIPDVSSADMEDLVGGGDEGNNVVDDASAAGGADSGYGSAASSVLDGAGGGGALSSTGNTIATGRGKKKVEESWETEADADAQAEEDEDAWDKDEEEEAPQTVAELEQGFLNIYKAFSKLKKEFDEKFRAMFA